MKSNWPGNRSWRDCDVCEVPAGSAWRNLRRPRGRSRTSLHWNRKHRLCRPLLIDTLETREDVNPDTRGMTSWYMGIYTRTRTDPTNGRSPALWCESNEPSPRIERGASHMRAPSPSIEFRDFARGSVCLWIDCECRPDLHLVFIRVCFSGFDFGWFWRLNLSYQGLKDLCSNLNVMRTCLSQYQIILVFLMLWMQCHS